MAVCNVHDFILSASALSSHTLDLSRKEIIELPDDLPNCNKLESLHLEGNKLKKLPSTLFTSCPNLRWLDLRNNQLKTIPASIEKLKSLRTLLLEGNQITSLPVQLCRLTHLTGLNITRNPLEDPPRHITEKGTRAVLGYLREKEDGGTHSSDSNSSIPDSGMAYIPLKPIAVNSESAIISACHPHEYSGSSRGAVVPVPLMKPATLHRQVPNKHHHHRLDALSTPHRKKRKKGRRGKGAELTPIPPPPLQRINTQDSVMAAEINITLDRIKSKQGLEDWRDQAKMEQKLKVRMKDQPLYPKAVDTAPFATESTRKSEENSPAENNLKDQRLGFGSSRSEIEDRIKLHMSQLEEQREQVGLIPTPSSVLKEAEKHLAEALVMQEHLDERKSREYRLTAAFTSYDC